MRVLCFVLPRLDSDAGSATNSWLTVLEEVCSKSGTIFWPYSDQNVEDVRRAMWMGKPFLIAGRNKHLLKFLDQLDRDSVAVLKDCAYWWCLSDSADLAHEVFPSGRPVVLNWNHQQQNIIRDALLILTSLPELKGLSESSHHLRKEVLRIASGPAGPNRSVLILGGSGCGKEVVFRALIKHNKVKHEKPSRATGGAWLNMEPGMAMTELVGLERNLKEERFEGLLQRFTDGSLFFDDFESAPKNIQETLLRIMEDERGEYYSVGGSEPRHTNAWLLFATNRPLIEFINSKELRPDFFYRFGARIISIPPLMDRIADVPAIAHSIWQKAWGDVVQSTSAAAKEESDLTELRSDAIRRLLAAEIDWSGNTRTLRSALELVIAMMRDPEYNGYSQADLMSVLLARGRSPMEWLRVFEYKPSVSGHELEERIRKADYGHPREKGPSDKEQDPLEVFLTPSEAAAKDSLTPEAWKRFRKRCRSAPATKGKHIRVSVRLARIIWYVSLSQSVNWKLAQVLTGAAEATVRRDLAHLADGDDPFIHLIPDTQPPAYERVSEMFI